MRHLSHAALVVTAAWCGTARAQSPSLVVGQQVRVTAPAQGLDARALTLLAATPDTLVLAHLETQVEGSSWRTDTTRMPVAVGAVTRLEVQGWRNHVVVGALIGGGGVGLLTYLIVKGGESETCGWFDFFCWKPGTARKAALVAGGVGLALGTLTGALWRTQVWESVPLDRLHGLHLGLTPQPGGRLGVGLSLAF